jgi:hypothetical protein
MNNMYINIDVNKGSEKCTEKHCGFWTVHSELLSKTGGSQNECHSWLVAKLSVL